MPKRTCLHCGELTGSGRCPCCTTTARGYGSDWQRTTARILERDGHLCQLQLPGCEGHASTTDHVLAKALGGSDDDANLVAACRRCNSRKGRRRQPIQPAKVHFSGQVR